MICDDFYTGLALSYAPPETDLNRPGVDSVGSGSTRDLD